LNQLIVLAGLTKRDPGEEKHQQQQADNRDVVGLEHDVKKLCKATFSHTFCRVASAHGVVNEQGRYPRPPLAVVRFFDIKGAILTGEGRGILMLRWLPEDVSPYGPGIDSLFYFIYYITAAAFILVTA